MKYFAMSRKSQGQLSSVIDLAKINLRDQKGKTKNLKFPLRSPTLMPFVEVLKSSHLHYFKILATPLLST